MPGIVLQQDFWLEIAKGKLPGLVTEYLGIGFNTLPHTNISTNCVWNTLSPYPESPPIGKVSITSSSASDTLLGTGARQVEIHGTNAANGRFISEIVNTNGTAAVLTTQDFSSVSGLSRIVTVGTLGTGGGTIIGRMGGVIVLLIDPGFSEGSHSFLSVPTEVTAILFGISYSSRLRVEMLTQIKLPGAGMIFTDIDRTDVIATVNFDYSRTPVVVTPGSQIRTIMRSPHYFGKAKVSWRLALIDTVAL